MIKNKLIILIAIKFSQRKSFQEKKSGSNSPREKTLKVQNHLKTYLDYFMSFN